MPFFSNRNAVAWVVMMLLIAAHVVDEASTGFLPMFNDTILGLTQNHPSLPLSPLSFRTWIIGLLIAIAVGFAVTPLVYRGSRVIRIVTLVVGLLMVVNACGHMIGSIWLGRFLPGFWSSPFLLAGSKWVVTRAVRLGNW